jgi:catechol 2,3-dioxygenase-like lactoylglutathione lyase family enzyme
MLKDSPVAATLAVKDIERAKRFYSETLGLEAKDEDDGGVFMECGEGTGLFVYPSEFAGSNKATAAAWKVDDLDAVMSELRGKGVTFEEYDMPGLKTENGVATWGDGNKGAWFKDPDGNILSVGQM